jgi:NTE family protein
MAATETLKADLVLEGGGVKGIALVGAIEVLEKAGYRFPRVAGTSAGAIVGSLVAARVPAAELKQIMDSTDYRRFQDEGPLQRFTGPAGDVMAMLVEKGLYEGNYLVEYLRGHLGNARVNTFADVPLDPDPESHLRGDEAFRLVVMSADVSRRRLAHLPWDYHLYGLTPAEQEIALAVRASMSIPFFFEPYKLTWQEQLPDGKTKETTNLFVDGGMLSNFPVSVFDRPVGEEPRWPTFGIKLSARQKNKSLAREVGGPIGYCLAMLGTLCTFYDAMHVDRADVQDRTIFVDTMDVKATDFELDENTQKLLYDKGRTAAEQFLATWDFDAYKAKHRGPQEAASAGHLT